MFDFLKGGRTSVKLILDHMISDKPLQVAPYFPGETVHARVNLSAEKEIKIREGRIALVTREEYKYQHRETSRDSHGHTHSNVVTSWGTDEREINRQVFLGETLLPANTQQMYEFDLPIPNDAPPSAISEIVKINWMVKATLDRKMAGDIEDKIEVPLFIGKPSLPSQPLPAGISNEPDEAELVISLPGFDWVMGEMVAGQMQVNPKKEFDATEIRVELVCRAKVFRDLGNEHETTISTRVAAGTHLVPGQYLTFPFNIQIPAPVCGTLITPNSRVDWELKGVLARRLRKDTVVAQGIRIYNGIQK